LSPADRERVKDLLIRAAGLPPPKRRAFIEFANFDREIISEALDLLPTLDDSAFLSAPTGAGFSPPSSAPLAGEQPGAKVGRYKLLQLIGEGGFGSVFMAEQTEPVHRRVALKIIKAGMDTKQVIARFEAERQALALMDHPNIARVLDAGATDSARPFFVMELVRGDPMNRYCDREELSVRRRVELFRDVCNAVQHAHQKGVIHRDLKPSNVLVTVSDGQPLPKVIDFGIAKATSGRLTDRTLFTELHQLIGTPEYMSPEQAEVSGVDIDTRSDIYSLGVMLYELLVGSTPLEGEKLRTTPMAEIQRLIREDEPQRPSLRLGTMIAADSRDTRFRTAPQEKRGRTGASSAIEIARRRRSEPTLLTRSLRGDLDWIVMKCLEKDRGRRYPTAGALADDVGRYLTDQPVSATPPRLAYKLKKFVRRNRGTVFAGGAIAATLLIATAVSVAFAISATRQRGAAEFAKTRAETAEHAAEARAAELEQVAKFQQAQLSGIDAQTMGERLRADLLNKSRSAAVRSKLLPEDVDARVAELEELIAGSDFTGMALKSLNDNFFQPALAAIDEQFADQPLVQARLLQASADALYELGLYDAAWPPQERALAIRRRVLGDDHPDTLSSISLMGFVLQAQGKLAEAGVYFGEALERSRRVLGKDNPLTLNSINSMGLLLHEQGKLDEAESHYREALEGRRRTLGEEHPETLSSINNMGFLRQAQGRLAEAEIYLREALEKFRRVMGDDDPNTLIAINNMGALLYAQGKLSEAEPYFHEAIDISRQVLGIEHHDTLRAMDNMSVVLRALGRFSEAEVYCRESMELHRHGLGDGHPDTIISIGNMGVLLTAQGKLSEAEPYLNEALETSRRVLGDEHPDTLRAFMNLGYLQLLEGRLAEAEPHLRQALEGRRRVLGDEHPDTLAAIGNMGALLVAQGRAADAIELLISAEPACRRTFSGGNAPRLARFLTALGCARAATSEFESAKATLTEAHAILSGADGATRRDRADVLTCLVELFDAWHEAEPDKGYGHAAAEWRARVEENTAKP
jgi:serine/threonine protein kinase/tetratricopeptide (TPR) repeat protein